MLQAVEYKPVPLKTGEDEDYMLALKQEMRGTMKRLPSHIPLCEKKAVVKKKPKETSKEKEELLTKLDELEKKDEGEDEETEGKKPEEGEEEEEEMEGQEYDEEELEEENDYINSYFEDGDDYGACSDDNMDEATY
ncbi:hypothetical protein JZ751_001056 [Albula glossodonta]|uniref:DNA-directed RNA polymerase III subunit n=1 Tax=Albula glossodonta TaxID=121402 RepID=A0A8T2PSM7_9TELE|nr:hypothetical protein JZ751_001056 [Albula glossodonta]